MPRETTIKAAAAELGVSERTVNRMIDDGRLDSRTDGRRRIVVMPDEVVSEDVPTDPPPQQADVVPVSQASVPAVVEVAVLRAKLDALERENERLWRLVETQEARAAIALPAPRRDATEKPGLLARLKAYWR